MPQGLEVFDANGKSILNVSDRLGKIHTRNDFSVPAHGSRTVGISVPALTSGQSRLVVMQQRYGSIPTNVLDRYGVFFEFTSYVESSGTSINARMANSNRSASTYSVYVGAI